MPRKRAKKKSNDQRIIANMGLFWSRDKVRWRGNAGIGAARLAGVRSVKKKSGEVDFWDQTGIYSLYDANYRLVYAGQAGLSDKSCLGKRLKQHLKDDLAGRWEKFSWFGQRVVNKSNKLGVRRKINISTGSQLANILEGVIIEVAEPPLNSQGGRFGRKVERYIQIDDSIDLAAEEQAKALTLIRKLGDKVENTRQRLTKHALQSTTRLDKKLSKATKKLAKTIRASR